jgi:hypothetical protein
LIATTAAVLVVFVIHLGWQRRQENIVHARILNNFELILSGLSNYMDANSMGLPMAVTTAADGVPLNSWRFKIIPFLQSWGLKVHTNESWTNSVNSRFRAMPLEIYCWSDPQQSAATNIFAITGPDTMFDGDIAGSVFRVPLGTIMLMEVADSKTHWMQPGDYDVTKLLAAAGRLGDTVKGIMKDRIHILFADGEVWALSSDTPIEALKPFLTITAAKSADREQDLAPYRVDEY